MQSATPIFNSEELKQNEFVKQKLIKLLKSCEGILMVGSGCSASIYPDWPGFVKLLSDEAINTKHDFTPFSEDTENFLNFADRVKDCIGEELYYNLIYRCFKPQKKKHEKFHEVLCKLLVENKIKGITTTNYETVIESAMVAVTGELVDPVWIDPNMEQAKIFEYLQSLNDNDISRNILHFHGLYHQKGSIILSNSEYERKYGFSLLEPANSIYEAVKNGGMSEAEFSQIMNNYGMNWTLHRKMLWSLFATRRLIFIGFSLNDPFFNKMLEYVSNDLHTYGYEMHFLILRIANMEEKDRALLRAKHLKERFGIETIFFEENKNQTGLSNFIFEMESLVSENKIETKPDETKEEKVDLEGNEELTKKLIELNRSK